MKQKWLVTANDISPTISGGTPINYRDDAIAFGLNITSTGASATGSVWIEYNVEFASPRVPEPMVNASVVNANGNISIINRSGYMCPVDPGQNFYISSTSGNSFNLSTGYTSLESGVTEGVTWTLVKRAIDATSNVWGAVADLTTGLVAVLTSENINALIRARKTLSVS